MPLYFQLKNHNNYQDPIYNVHHLSRYQIRFEYRWLKRIMENIHCTTMKVYEDEGMIIIYVTNRKELKQTSNLCCDKNIPCDIIILQKEYSCVKKWIQMSKRKDHCVIDVL